jgi:hypothetical protein
MFYPNLYGCDDELDRGLDQVKRINVYIILSLMTMASILLSII